MKNAARSELQAALHACRNSFLAVGGFSMFINLLMLVPPFYMLQVYDRVVTSGSMPTLTMLTLLMAFLLISMGGLEWVRSGVLVRVSARLNALLGARIHDVCFRRALLTGGAATNSQPLQDFNGLRQFLSSNGPFAFFDAPWLPIYLLVMFWFHPYLGVLGVIGALILIAFAVANEKLTGPPLSEANAAQAESAQMTQTNLRNAEVIASMGMLESLRKRWEERNQRVLSFQSRASDLAGTFTSISKTFRLIIQSLALGLGALLVVRQEISPGAMIAGSILLGRALAPVDLMIGSWKGFVAARGQYGRLNQLLDSIPAEADRLSLPAPAGLVTAEGAAVVPPGAKKPVVFGVSFRIEPGTLTAVVGPSAAGKSTLIRAILGVWPTVAGSVRIDGAEAASYRREELGPHVGYLPQDIELFDGTVSENIARFGDIEATEVVAAAQAAGVHDMILHLPDGYDTVIGQSGGVLSGGQRQRIGLARALYRDPAIVVLDEPNSNLDDQGNEALRNALRGLKERKRTVFIVSHRTAVLAEVDMILLMREGQLADAGPRDAVLARLQEQAGQKNIKLAAANPNAGPGSSAARGPAAT